MGIAPWLSPASAAVSWLTLSYGLDSSVVRVAVVVNRLVAATCLWHFIATSQIKKTTLSWPIHWPSMEKTHLCTNVHCPPNIMCNRWEVVDQRNCFTGGCKTCYRKWCRTGLAARGVRCNTRHARAATCTDLTKQMWLHFRLKTLNIQIIGAIIELTV